MGRTLYKIRNWDKHFEDSSSRKLKKLSWAPIPNKHDGKGYRRLIASKNGPAIYGAWILIVQVASKCPERGTLSDEDGPLDASDLEVKTGVPAALFTQTLELLASQRIGWIVAENLPLSPEASGDSPNVSADSPEASGKIGAEGNGMEWKGREQNGSVSSPEPDEPASVPEPALLTFPTVGNLKTWNLTAPLVLTLSAAFPHLDVMAEARKALAWAEVNPSNRKTAAGMPKFLNGWMGRAQNNGRAGPQQPQPRVHAPVTSRDLYGDDQ